MPAGKGRIPGPSESPQLAIGGSDCAGLLPLRAPPGLPPPPEPWRQRSVFLDKSCAQAGLDLGSLLEEQSGAKSGEGMGDADESSDCSTADALLQDNRSLVDLPTEGLPLGGASVAIIPDVKLRRVLSLRSAVPEPAPLGSNERPTIGSTGHHLGLCKPCAHAFSGEGCWNGPQCNFCHLCGPEELKRRKQERQLLRRAMGRRRRAAPEAVA